MSWVFTQENMLKLLSDKIESYKKIVHNVTAFQAKKNQNWNCLVSVNFSVIFYMSKLISYRKFMIL